MENEAVPMERRTLAQSTMNAHAHAHTKDFARALAYAYCISMSFSVKFGQS